MTDEELQVIRRAWDEHKRKSRIAAASVLSGYDSGEMLEEQAQERERILESAVPSLLAENEALREVARAVAELKPQSIEADYYNEPLGVPCPFCGYDEVLDEEHTADCPVTKTRAILGNDGTQS